MFAYQFSRYRHRAEALGCTPFAMMQPQYNLLYREEEREMIPTWTEECAGIMSWSPSAGGALCGHSQENPLRSHTRFWGNPSYISDEKAILKRLAPIAVIRGGS